MKIYFSVHADKIYSKIAGLVRAYIHDCYCVRENGIITKWPEIYSSRDFVHSSEIDRFNALHDSVGMFVLPNEWALDSHQIFELKVWLILQKKYGARPVYAIFERNGEWICAKAEFVEGGLREISQKRLEDK